MERKVLFTSESVSEGHPDKVCDKIADAILDYVLNLDKEAHLAIECFVSENFLLIGGEVLTSLKNIDYKKIAKEVIKDIGYSNDDLGFNYNNLTIELRVNTQSPDINRGIKKDTILNQGAGDQGIMFGYATNETKGYMPLPIVIAHKLVREASILRKNKEFKYSRPDMKSQVTIDYSGHKPKIDTILMSCQHDENYNEIEFKKYIHDEIMVKVAKSFNLNTDFKYLINPTGKFVIGGPKGDTGLTGRKIIVDTYGGSASHGGGSFSGKDPSKVDRSAAYYARYMAKNLVAANIADRIEIELSYAIGVSEPISISFKTYKTSHYDDDLIYKIINKFFDARPGSIIKEFNLLSPSFRYQDLSNYGHFGRPDLDLPWEKLDKVESILNFVKNNV